MGRWCEQDAAAGAKLVSVGLLQQEDMDRALLATADPTASWFSLGLVTAWGRRP
jgi:hypothetical protein